MQSLLYPFPRTLLNAQSAQFVRYDCKEIDSDACDDDIPISERKFTVWMSTSNLTASSHYSDYSQLSRVGDAELTRRDTIGDDLIVPLHGEQGRSVHVTTLRSCSCQYTKCWGLPCRHMFKVMSAIGWDCWKECMAS